MYTGRDAFFDIHDPQPVETPRDLTGIITKVFRTHAHLGFQHPVRSHKLSRLCPCDPVEDLIVIDHGIPDIDVQIDLRPHAVDQLGSLLADQLMRPETPFLVHRAESTHELDLAGDHIGGMTALYTGDR